MRITLKEVVIAYAQGIFEARVPEQGGDPKYTAAFLFSKDHSAVKQLTDAVVAVAKEKWGVKADETLKQLKAADRLPVHSGDAKPNSAGYASKLYVNAGNKIRPVVIDANKGALTAADGRPYSGSVVNVILDIWPQDNKFGKRINASLLGVQFVRDGERLAGGSMATADDFEAIPGTEGETAPKSAADALLS